MPGFGSIAAGRDDLTPGTPVHVLLRLETIRLSKEEQSPENIGFTVGEIVNYGDSFLVIGKSAGQELRARVPGLDMPVLARGSAVASGGPRSASTSFLDDCGADQPVLHLEVAPADRGGPEGDRRLPLNCFAYSRSGRHEAIL